MENTENYAFTADNTPEKQKKEKFNLAPSESVFFGQMEKSLKQRAADMTAPNPLEKLYENIHRLDRLFITFGHPWLADSGIIQKACAWYLAYAKPTKAEARHLIETLNGFTSSACYLSEWNVLIIEMQKFFHTQGKELRRLFEYQRETEKKHKEWMERLNAEGIAYCMTVGEGEIYGILYPQIEELYKVMGRFIEREKAPFECKVKGYEEYCVSISKDIGLYADRDEFHISYSLGTFDSDFDCMPAGQMQRFADIISDFLKVFGENGDRKVHWDIADYPKESQPDIAFGIKEDGRLPTFRTVPWISKRIHKKENEEPEIEYFIDINEIHSPELSFSEFVAVYRKLGDFLNSYPNNADPASR